MYSFAIFFYNKNVFLPARKKVQKKNGESTSLSPWPISMYDLDYYHPIQYIIDLYELTSFMEKIIKMTKTKKINR